MNKVKSLQDLKRLCGPMCRENRRLVVDEPVEVEDFKKFTNHSRIIYGIYLK